MVATLATKTLVVDWLFTALALVGVIVHFTVSSGRQLWWNDWMLLPSFVVGLATVTQTTWAILREGQAGHRDGIPRQSWHALAESLIVNEVLWTVSSTCLRLSSGFLMWKLFSLGSRTSVPLMVYTILCCCHGFATVVTVFLICRPLQSSWDPTVVGHCGDQLLAYVLMETFGLVLDVFIFIYPLPFVLRLQIKTRRKIFVLVVLDMGIVLSAVSILRLKALHLAVSSDFTYSQSYLGMLSALAVMLGLSLLALEPLWSWTNKRFLPETVQSLRERWFSSHGTRTRTKTTTDKGVPDDTENDNRSDHTIVGTVDSVELYRDARKNQGSNSDLTKLEDIGYAV